MKIKTTDLMPPALTWVVAKCEDRKPGYYKGEVRANATPEFPDSPPMFGPELNYPTDWAQGGPIIEREGICLYINSNGLWEAWLFVYGTDGEEVGRNEANTPLIAAMRCYVASKLGEIVEVPSELYKEATQ